MFVKYKNIKDGNTFKTNKHKNLKANTDIFHLIKKTYDCFLFHFVEKSLIRLYLKTLENADRFSSFTQISNRFCKHTLCSKECLLNK